MRAVSSMPAVSGIESLLTAERFARLLRPLDAELPAKLVSYRIGR